MPVRFRVRSDQRERGARNRQPSKRRLAPRKWLRAISLRLLNNARQYRSTFDAPKLNHACPELFYRVFMRQPTKKERAFFLLSRTETTGNQEGSERDCRKIAHTAVAELRESRLTEARAKRERSKIAGKCPYDFVFRASVASEDHEIVNHLSGAQRSASG